VGNRRRGWLATLTNTPERGEDAGLVRRAVPREAAAGLPIDVSVREAGSSLARDGFGGILAVGGGSDRRVPDSSNSLTTPATARVHVVLVGKGITFDTGGHLDQAGRADEVDGVRTWVVPLR